MAPSANLVMTFAENIQAGTGNITLYRADTNVAVAIIAASDTSQITISGKTLTINPTADLVGGVAYYVNVDATAIQDTAGNAYAGITDTTSWNFAGVTPVTANITSLSSDTGSSSSDWLTNAPTQTISGAFSGALTADQTIQVSADGSTWTNANISGSTWNAPNVSLVDTSLDINWSTLSVRIHNNTTGADIAGTGHTYKLDTVAPAAPTISNTILTDTNMWGGSVHSSIVSGQASSDTTLGLSGTGEAGTSLLVRRTYTNTVTGGTSTTTSATVSVQPDGTWSYTTAGSTSTIGADGKTGYHSYSAQVTDAAGNTANSATAANVFVANNFTTFKVTSGTGTGGVGISPGLTYGNDYFITSTGKVYGLLDGGNKQSLMLLGLFSNPTSPGDRMMLNEFATSFNGGIAVSSSGVDANAAHGLDNLRSGIYVGITYVLPTKTELQALFTEKNWIAGAAVVIGTSSNDFLSVNAASSTSTGSWLTGTPGNGQYAWIFQVL